MKKKYLILIYCFLINSLSLSAQNDFHSYVVQEVLPTTNRVQEFYWQDQKYWLKKMSKDKNSWVMKIGRQLGAVILPIKFLKTTPFQQDNILKFEKERLFECERLNVRCPRIIDFDEDWMVLKDAGISCEQYLKKLPQNQKLGFIKKLIILILENQQKGFLHGRCFIRDMLISPEGEITVFDIEEDPIKVMKFSDAKAREIFFFLFSVYEKIDDQQTQELLKWLNKILQEDVKVNLLELKNYHKLMIAFNCFVKYLGRDGKRFLDVSFLLIENLTLSKN